MNMCMHISSLPCWSCDRRPHHAARFTLFTPALHFQSLVFHLSSPTTVSSPVQLGVVALVSKLWRSVATDPSWKPELLALAWGAQVLHTTTYSQPHPAPYHTLLPTPTAVLTTRSTSYRMVR